jgi:2-desacetyl-2-hydroxyethyl bacteriochlorophyllide A dehydrogenase
MQAIQFSGPGQIEPIDIPSPGAPGVGEALVATSTMGVCGTDISAYLGRFPFFEFPRIPGHELGVEVLEVGGGVTNVRVGERCAVEPYMNCGHCYACRRGATNCCERLSVIGVMENGGLCEQFLIPAAKLHPSAELSFEQLALVETLGIGCHAVNRADIQPGQSTLVIGVGPIGLAALEFARLAGGKITVMDTQATRLDFVRATYGVERCVDASAISPAALQQTLLDLTAGDGHPVVIDATGNKSSMATAIGYVAHGGTLVFLGLTRENISFPQPEMHRREIQIKASRNALPADFARIIGLIAAGSIDTGPWVTHRTSFAEMPNTFESFTKPETGVIKAMIDVASAGPGR